MTVDLARFGQNVRDASRLMHWHSREDFRRVPLEFVVVPSLDAPVLVFPWDESPVYTDIDGRQFAIWPALEEARAAYRRTADPIKRARLAKLMRRYWLAAVDQAEGYTWPDATHYGVRAVYQFDPDA